MSERWYPVKLDKIAEQQILKAQRQGEFDQLEGEGKPLSLNVKNHGSEAFGYQTMADAGVVPEEIRLRREIEALSKQLQTIVDTEERKPFMQKLGDLQMRLAIQEEARRRFYD